MNNASEGRLEVDMG